MGIRFVGSAVAFFVMAAPAVGQERLFRSVDAVAGKQVRVAIVGNVTPDCKVGPKPEVKVVSPPTHGVLAIRSGKTKPGSLPRCPNLEIPAQGVFYQPQANFTGADEIVYEVSRPGAPTRNFTVKINVKAAGAPGQKPKEDSTDL